MDIESKKRIPAKFEDLLNKTLTSVKHTKKGLVGDLILFTTDTGNIYEMYHSQDCCEGVYIDDINGDWEDIIGTPLLLAEESSCSTYDIPNSICGGELQWTFYRLATNKGYVNLTWRGESNGYYSISVSFAKLVE